MKPTTDPETLSKDHKGVFWSVRGTMALLKNMNVFIQLILLHTSQNTMLGLRSKELRQWSTSIRDRDRDRDRDKDRDRNRDRDGDGGGDGGGDGDRARHRKREKERERETEREKEREK